MGKPKITYLLGAGASYNALPIIDELGKGFGAIGDTCKLAQRTMKLKKTNHFPESQKAFIEWMHQNSLNAAAFNTIDTYAKKLSINNQMQELEDLKIALSLFFVIWQEIGDRKELNKKIGRDIKQELKTVDTRYISLLSNFLLDTDKRIQLPPNINFISWNYDIQLERGLKAFVEKPIQEIFNDFKVFPWIDKGFPKIIHLNGIAGIYSTDGKISHLFDEGPSPRETDRIFSDLLSHVDSYKKSGVSNNQQFSYAWEKDEVSQKAVSYAEQIMEETNVLVIIGYSFPSFNQEIDRRLFAKLSNNRAGYKVYYQDPNANAATLANKMNIRKDMIIEEKNDMRQFIIPYEYFV